MAAVLRGLTAALAPLVLVVAGTAAVLRMADWAPAVLGGEPRGVRRYMSIEEAERATRARVRLPAFFPDTLGWPPARVRLAVGRPASLAVVVAGRAGSMAHLVVAQTLGARGPISPLLLGPGVTLQSAAIEVAGRAATLTRLSLAGGALVHQVTWDSVDRTVSVRFDGPLDQLLRMADSLERTTR